MYVRTYIIYIYKCSGIEKGFCIRKNVDVHLCSGMYIYVGIHRGLL